MSFPSKENSSKKRPLSYYGIERGRFAVKCRPPRRPCGVGVLAFTAGIFVALVCPLWLIAAIEGALIIILGVALLNS